MFLLVSVRHVCAHPGGHQHSVSMQISMNLAKTFLRVSRIRNILVTWIMARVSVYLPPFISQIPNFIYWTVLIFILIYFEWRDTENQQYKEGRFNLLDMLQNEKRYISWGSTFKTKRIVWRVLFPKQPNIMARHNVIYIEAWCARDIPLGLACTRHRFDTSISLANQV